MNCRILAVEDSPTQAEVLHALLSEEYEVTLARSGENALEHLAEAEFDLVVSDIVMPGISGYELCRRIKAGSEGRYMPVILLTSLHDPMDIVRGLEAGADNYVTKPYDPEHLLARIRHVLNNRRLRSFPRSSMGVSISFLGNEFTITSDKEQILDLLLSSVEDVIRANEALELARAEAEAANRAKSEFLSRMSHELRTPLNAILGFGQLLAASVGGAEDRESLDEILAAGQHLLNLINEVLDISRIEAGRLDLTPEAVHVRQLVEQLLGMVAPLATPRDITLRSTDAACAVYVWADRQRLKQVLLNLLSNAIKYNRESGNVTVSCEALPDGWLRLSVADSGAGIDAEDLPRLFTPFSRLAAHASIIPGTGLGLALSKGLMEEMGGEIGVESVPGQGSTFWLKVPLAELPARAEDPTRTPAVAKKPGLGTAGEHTVLYVEDNPSNLRLVERILAQRPAVKLLTAAQGRLGLELALRHNPDLILLDLQLPDMPGMELLQRLRGETATRNIPIIVVSADATSDQNQLLRAMGANDYLTKPFELQELLRLVDEALFAEGTESGSSPERG